MSEFLQLILTLKIQMAAISNACISGHVRNGQYFIKFAKEYTSTYQNKLLVTDLPCISNKYRYVSIPNIIDIFRCIDIVYMAYVLHFVRFVFK